MTRLSSNNNEADKSAETGTGSKDSGDIEKDSTQILAESELGRTSSDGSSENIEYMEPPDGGAQVFEIYFDKSLMIGLRLTTIRKTNSLTTPHITTKPYLVTVC
jgi:hypothetical protein